MSISVYQKGDLVRVTGVFRDVDDTLIDPSVLVLKVTDPSGNTTELSYSESPSVVVRASVGNYYHDINVDEAGDWHYTWVSTGTGQATQLGEFVAEPLPY